jgi:hypothetical protein
MGKGLLISLAASLLFAAMPSSSSYELHNYGFGSGGTSNSSSENYSLQGTAGGAGGGENTSTNYKLRPGNSNAQQAYVPPAPVFTNPANYYNKLQFTLNDSGGSADTKYSIAISSDNFVTTQYVQNDNTVGPSLGLEDYQVYAAWGGSSGQLIVGLTPSTTYKIKVNAIQGGLTETEYGPEASAATVAPSITFDIDISATDTETAPPHAASFGALLPATVIDADKKIWIDLDTNADAGAKVYIRSANGGLKSSALNHTIASATADLASTATGYGAQGVSAGQSAGGPLSVVAPYNAGSQQVGALDTSLKAIFSSSTPLTSGRGSLVLKAKAAAQTPASDDYRDTLTLTAAAAF